jgi:hypothetical protein
LLWIVTIRPRYVIKSLACVSGARPLASLDPPSERLQNFSPFTTLFYKKNIFISNKMINKQKYATLINNLKILLFKTGIDRTNLSEEQNNKISELFQQHWTHRRLRLQHETSA